MQRINQHKARDAAVRQATHRTTAPQIKTVRAIQTAPRLMQYSGGAKSKIATAEAGRLVSRAANAGAQQSDSGNSRAVDTAIKTSAVAIRSFRASQAAADTTIKTVSMTGGAVVTAYRAGKCTVEAARFARSHFIPYTSTLTKNIWMRRARELGVFDTRTAKILTGEERLPKPKLKPKLTHRAADMTASVFTKSDDFMVHGIGKSVEVGLGVDRGIKTGVKGIRTTARAVRHTGKAVWKVGTATVRTGKALIRTAQTSVTYIAMNGWRNFAKHAWKRARKKAASAFIRIGRSVVNGIISFVKAAARKLVLPIILLVVGVFALFSMIAVPIATVGSLTSGVFNLVGADGLSIEINADDFLNDPVYGIPKLRADAMAGVAEELASNLKENGGTYDVTRVKVTPTGEPIAGTPDNVNIKFYPPAVISEMIKPVFNALIVAHFNLEITHEQGYALVEELFTEMYAVNYVTTTEYCGQDLNNGNGAAANPHAECGEIHALADCPNINTGYHTYFACAGCDRQVCAGHKGYLDCDHTTQPHDPWVSADEPGCYTTVTHSGSDAVSCGQPLTGVECSGYSYCGGHSVFTAVLDMTNLDELIYAYFTQPIATLEAMTDRTPELDKKLENLKLGYALCEIFMQDTPVIYGAEGFMNPVRYTDISSPFGWRLHPIYEDWRHHNGLDMSAPAGTPIYASKNGVVSTADYNSSAGNHVIIEHEDGFSTVYMHMTYSIVKPGETVGQGQVIGYVGSTGDSTGPHLHFEIRKNGEYLNPALYIDLGWMPGDPPKTGATEPTEE